jgi:hypothetical protein
MNVTKVKAQLATWPAKELSHFNMIVAHALWRSGRPAREPAYAPGLGSGGFPGGAIRGYWNAVLPDATVLRSGSTEYRLCGRFGSFNEIPSYRNF